MSKNDERYLLQALEIEGVLRACLYRYTRNNSDVDELLQEVYARLLVSGASGEPEVRSVRAFALTIARNVAFDWLRHRQVVPIELVADMEALEVLDEGEQIEEIVNSHQELAMLVKAIQGLPERCRQVFTLRKVYGYESGLAAFYFDLHAELDHEHATAARALIEPRPGAADEDALLAEAETVLRANWELLDGVERVTAARRSPTAG